MDIPNPVVRAHHAIINIDAQQKQFWEIEEAPVANQRLTEEKNASEEYFSKTHSRSPDGRYTVRLPLKSPEKPIGESRQAALQRRFTIERRMSRNEDLHLQYSDFMAEYLQLDQLKAIPEPNMEPNILNNRLSHWQYLTKLNQHPERDGLRIYVLRDSCMAGVEDPRRQRSSRTQSIQLTRPSLMREDVFKQPKVLTEHGLGPQTYALFLQVFSRDGPV
jgi:hypothetical protein